MFRLKKSPVGIVAFNAKPVAGSWGGGNQWLVQTARHLEYCGYQVRYDLGSSNIDCALILHSADSQGGTFGHKELQEYKLKNPRIKVLHRINENDARKGSDFMDAALKKMNELSDHTVFLSKWLKDHHHWFDSKKHCSVIWNGADSRYFHPVQSAVWKAGQQPLTLVTHHWSDHWKKGFKYYQEIDQAIESGKLPDTELWVVGRWPKEIQWKKAKTFGPCQGEDLAKLLRQAHVYVTGSQAEPGGMHFIEGLQCGLPLLYHVGGGGIVEVGRRVQGIPFEDNLVTAIGEMREKYGELKEQTLCSPISGESMTLQYLEIVRQLVAKSRSEK